MSTFTPCQARGSALSREDFIREVRVSVRASVRPRLTPTEEASREGENALRTGTLRCHFESPARSATTHGFFALAHWGRIPAICCRVGIEACDALGTDEKISRGAPFPFRAASVMSLVIREARPRPAKASGERSDRRTLARKNPDLALAGERSGSEFGPATAWFLEGKTVLIHLLLASPIS